MERYPAFAALVCPRTSDTQAHMVRVWNLYRKIHHNVANYLESLISLLRVRTFAEIIWTEQDEILHLFILFEQDDIC